jgi:hypothetical protein
MSSGREGNFLYVEGINDLYLLVHILGSHNVNCSKENNPTSITLKDSKSKNGVLGNLQTEWMSDGLPVGFILDADERGKEAATESAWAQVKNRVDGADLPPQISPDGWIGENAFGRRVGVWIMPNNGESGAIEDFIEHIRAQDDELYEPAQTATAAVDPNLENRYKDKDRAKATVRTWLAWHDAPDHHYRVAIENGAIDPNAKLAQRFIGWIRELYKL